MAVLAAAYGSFGYFWGSWVVIFGAFLSAHGLTPGAGSWRFVALSVTAIVAMMAVAPRLEPARRGVAIGIALVFHAAGSLLIAVASTPLLVVAFGVTGVGTGLVDVFVNAAGQEIEARTGDPVLQRVHGAYGVGGALGAIASGVALDAGMSWRSVLAAAALVQAAAALWSLRSSGLERRPDASLVGARLSLTAFVRWPYLLMPAAVVLAAFFVEGSMDVWSVIYLHRTLGASELAGGGAFAAFALATAVGRLFAARILFGMGYRKTIFLSGLGSAVAGAVAVTTSHPLVAAAAFLVLGFCISSAAPAAFGLAGRTGSGAGLAIAAMTTVGYTGFVAGPPVLGWLADQAGLRTTMTALMGATLVIAVTGFLGRRASDDEVVAPERITSATD